LKIHSIILLLLYQTRGKIILLKESHYENFFINILAVGAITSIAQSDDQTNSYIEILIKKNNFSSKTVERIKEYAPIIIDLSNELKVDPQLALSIAWTESHFKPESISNTGDIGIMQVQPSTQDYLINTRIRNNNYKDLYFKILNKYDVSYRIIDNLFIGVLYIQYLQEKFNNDTKKVIVSYNRGPYRN
jgi:soluble lytic murein transglycosylase-like protein